VVDENQLGLPKNIGEKSVLSSYEKAMSTRNANNDIHTEQIAASMRSGVQVATLAGIDVLAISVSPTLASSTSCTETCKKPGCLVNE